MLPFGWPFWKPSCQPDRPSVPPSHSRLHQQAATCTEHDWCVPKMAKKNNHGMSGPWALGPFIKDTEHKELNCSDKALILSVLCWGHKMWLHGSLVQSDLESWKPLRKPGHSISEFPNAGWAQSLPRSSCLRMFFQVSHTVGVFIFILCDEAFLRLSQVQFYF